MKTSQFWVALASRQCFPHGLILRVNFTSRSGMTRPSNSRSCERQMNELSSTNSIELFDEPAPPSLVTPTEAEVHLRPSRVQMPSPKPPCESKNHDRICPSAGSQPIIVDTDISSSPLTWI